MATCMKELPHAQSTSSEFASAKAGDKIEFTYTTDAVEYWQFKTQFAGTETLLDGNKADLNEWGCANVANGSTSYKITLSENDVMTECMSYLSDA